MSNVTRIMDGSEGRRGVEGEKGMHRTVHVRIQYGANFVSDISRAKEGLSVFDSSTLTLTRFF